MYSAFQLAYLSILFLVASFSAFLYLKKREKQEFLYVYLWVSFLLDFLMYIFQIFYKSNADFGFLYNIYIFFCGFFFLIYFNRDQIEKLKRINTIIFCVFSVIFLISIFNNFLEINQMVGISFSFLYILYSLIWFYGKIMYPDTNSIMNDPKFWVSSGLLFWGVFFILRIIPRYLFDKVDGQLLVVSQSFFFVVNIVFYTLFFISLLKYQRK